MPTILLHFLPYIAIGVMALGGWGLWQEHKLDQTKLANANAQIIQDKKDAAESAKQIGIFQGKMEALDAKAQPVIQRIVSSPTTTGCGPTVGYAIGGLRDLYDTSAAPAGRKPTQPPTVLSPNPAGQPQPHR